MVVGLGTDLVEVDRIKTILDKYGESFLNRILRPEEIAYCRTCAQAAPHVAARFAAKEAIAKAFGTGIGSQLSWKDMEIARHAHGEPYVRLHGQAITLSAHRGVSRVLISLSHTSRQATAVAMLERDAS